MADAKNGDAPLPPIVNMYEMLSRSASPAVATLFEETGFGFPSSSKPSTPGLNATYFESSRPSSRVDRLARTHDAAFRRSKTPDPIRERLPEVRPRDIHTSDMPRNSLNISTPNTVKQTVPERKALSMSPSPMKEKDRGKKDIFDVIGKQKLSLIEAVEAEFPNLFEDPRKGLDATHQKQSSFQQDTSPSIAQATPLEDLQQLNKDPSLRQSEQPHISIPTKIPKPFQVFEASPLAPTDPNLHAEYEAIEKLWKVRLFPAANPTSRQDVVMLERWMDCMVERVITKGADINLVARETHLLYTICLNEIVRQVSVQCVERGQLIGKIWNRYCLLFEMYLNYGGEVQKQLEKEKQAKCQELKEALDKIKGMEDMLGEKDRELMRALEAQDIIRSQLEDLQDTLNMEVAEMHIQDINSNLDSLSNTEDEDEDFDGVEGEEDEFGMIRRGSDMSEAGYRELLEAKEQMEREARANREAQEALTAQADVPPTPDGYSGGFFIPPIFALDDGSGATPLSKASNICVQLNGDAMSMMSSFGSFTNKSETASTSPMKPPENKSMARRGSFSRLMDDLRSGALNEDEFDHFLGSEKSPAIGALSLKQNMMKSKDKLSVDGDDWEAGKSARSRSQSVMSDPRKGEGQRGDRNSSANAKDLSSVGLTAANANAARDAFLKSGKMKLSSKIADVLTASELSEISGAHKGDETKKRLQKDRNPSSVPSPRLQEKPKDSEEIASMIVEIVAPQLSQLYITEKEMSEFLTSKTKKLAPAGLLSQLSASEAESESSSTDSEDKPKKQKGKKKTFQSRAKQVQTSIRISKALQNVTQNTKEKAPQSSPAQTQQTNESAKNAGVRATPSRLTRLGSTVSVTRKASILPTEPQRRPTLQDVASVANMVRKAAHRMSVCQPPQLPDAPSYDLLPESMFPYGRSQKELPERRNPSNATNGASQSPEDRKDSALLISAKPSAENASTMDRENEKPLVLAPAEILEEPPKVSAEKTTKEPANENPQTDATQIDNDVQVREEKDQGNSASQDLPTIGSRVAVETFDVGVQVNDLLDEDLGPAIVVAEMSEEQKQLEAEILRLRKELKRVSSMYSELREKTHRIAAHVKDKLVIPVGVFHMKRDQVSGAKQGMDSLYSRNQKPGAHEAGGETKFSVPFTTTEKAYLAMKQKLPQDIDNLMGRITADEYNPFAHNVRVKPVHYLLKRILSVLSEKAGVPQQYLYDPLNIFAYQYYMTRYGLKSISERHLVDLISNIRRRRNDHTRIYRFGQFMGLYDPLPDGCFFFYISMFRVLFEYHRVWFEFPNGTVLLPLSHAYRAAGKIFWDKPSELLMKLQIILESASIEGKSADEERLVDVDLFVEIMFQQYMGIDVAGPLNHIKNLSASANLVKVSQVDLAALEASITSKVDRKRSMLPRRASALLEEDLAAANFSGFHPPATGAPLFQTTHLQSISESNQSHSKQDSGSLYQRKDPLSQITTQTKAPGFSQDLAPAGIPDARTRNPSVVLINPNSSLAKRYGSYWANRKMSYSAMLASLGAADPGGSPNRR
eukprot:TRINITY_DN7469_c0_g1_i1.p1 TRINITY_DN7469_c0_g1~~TRINITY_DN7469_c0_g1_i1.p1  ORF type:complete len:1543 (+),score=349.36 TRINITY_DN7469_c0_g1_i1:110-4738(+)